MTTNGLLPFEHEKAIFRSYYGACARHRYFGKWSEVMRKFDFSLTFITLLLSLAAISAIYNNHINWNYAVSGIIAGLSVIQLLGRLPEKSDLATELCKEWSSLRSCYEHLWLERNERPKEETIEKWKELQDAGRKTIDEAQKLLYLKPLWNRAQRGANIELRDLAPTKDGHL